LKRVLQSRDRLIRENASAQKHNMKIYTWHHIFSIQTNERETRNALNVLLNMISNCNISLPATTAEVRSQKPKLLENSE